MGRLHLFFPFIFFVNCWLHPCNIAYLIFGRGVSRPIIWCINFVTYRKWYNSGIIRIYNLTFSRCHLRRKRNNYLKWYDQKILFIVYWSCCMGIFVELTDNLLCSRSAFLHGSLWIPGLEACLFIWTHHNAFQLRCIQLILT